MTTNEVSRMDKNILIGCTGSVATIKIPLLLESLEKEFSDSNFKIHISLIVTDKSKHFFKTADIPPTVKLYSDEDEWTSWKDRGDPVIHIDLSKWADLMIIAPLGANSLAKISQGMCDNLLTCTVRAWPMEKPLLFCPAMNTKMWHHPITAQQVSTLKSWGYIEVACISKQLMCGDTGLGAMAEVSTIVQSVKEHIRME
ncbi:phosphopantothenoylcysteine decarboxylase [Arctopsyche grandis]|uniref:phosphopantothenoylcysteine decarboxylase n=1 Tax=Arctopsyche grandis TaxID=121162 RepID=UPI00406D7316